MARKDGMYVERGHAFNIEKEFKAYEGWRNGTFNESDEKKNERKRISFS